MMLAIRQKAVRYSGTPGAYQALRRASTGHGKTWDHNHHAGSKNEPLGTQLYVILAVIPLCYGTYLLSRPSEDGTAPTLSKLIESYSQYKERWAERNTTHTNMIEQAAFDRHLFQSSKGSAHIDLKFPEILNMSSPHNVPAGQGGANLDKLVAHYEKLNADAEEKKAQTLAAIESSKK